MSHPFDNLRVFILRKTTTYKSIIEGGQDQDQGAHNSQFWGECDARITIITSDEMRTRQYFPVRLEFHIIIFN